MGDHTLGHAVSQASHFRRLRQWDIIAVEAAAAHRYTGDNRLPQHHLRLRLRLRLRLDGEGGPRAHTCRALDTHDSTVHIDLERLPRLHALRDNHRALHGARGTQLDGYAPPAPTEALRAGQFADFGVRPERVHAAGVVEAVVWGGM